MIRVLIVDDQPAFRRVLGQLLTRAGLVVVGEVGTVAEAEALARVVQPDLAVVDVMLPGVNGLEGTRRLKTLFPDLRVILISAYRDRADQFQVAAAEVGAEVFIPKDDLDLSAIQAWKDLPGRKL
ncbi:MAG TPA: response regulator transcription factor [Anaerolineae bacterium]|nr:response regulator transcription factor [Anaerolineae bacterium]HQK13082.1 response regulator transcription factor [Anaerolineae bacterium]